MVSGAGRVMRAGVAVLVALVVANAAMASVPRWPGSRSAAAAVAPTLVARHQLPAPLPDRGRVFRLYRAFFLRDPDLGGMVHWESRHFLDDVPLYAIADRFASSEEFQRRYGALSDAQFVTLVYQNILDRQPDPAGVAYWRNRLAGGLSRGALMVGFSESAEYARVTGTSIGHLVAPVPPRGPGALPAHDDWLGWLNLHRDGAGLALLSENPAWSAGAAQHARYAIGHQRLDHDQDPSLPLHTPDGHAAAQSSNLLGSGTELTSQQAIGSWLNSPGHGAWMINPDWTVTGFGEHHDPTAGALRWVGVLDVVRGVSAPQGPPPLVRFPAPNQVVHYEPLRAFVIFPVPILTATLTASATVNGQSVPVTVAPAAFGGHPSNTAVVTLANRPTTGDAVALSVVAGSQSTSWSFEVGTQLPDPPQVPSASTTPSGLIALRIAPDAGTEPGEVTRQIVELWQGTSLLERVVVGSGPRTVYLHAGPPKAGLEVRASSHGPAGRSAPRVLRY